MFASPRKSSIARPCSIHLKQLAAGAALMAAASLTPAQEQVGNDDSTITYPASYFEQFQVNSVNDMLDRIPGINLARGGGGGGDRGGPGSSGGSSRRGLGGGGDQVLINGRRIAGKENEGNSQLSRIPASQVQHIEIIRGTSSELDVRGGSQVINVVLLEAQSNISGAFEVNTDHTFDGQNTPGVKASVTGQRGAFNYFLSAEEEPRWEYRDSREDSYLADGSPNDKIVRLQTRDAAPQTLVSNLGYEFSLQTIAHLNLQWSKDDQDTELDRTIVDYTAVNPEVTLQFEPLLSRNDSWEVGGDFEHQFGNGARFKTLFIVNDQDSLFTRERYGVEDSQRDKELFLSSFERTRERIVRSSYTTSLTSSQALEAGVERAQTILDTSLQLGLALGGEVSDLFGGLTPARNANGSVEEMRYEYFAIHNWQINSRMALESTVIFEDSTITQSGDVYQSRDFEFIRPKVDYRFDITPSLQFRTTIEKDVAQLSFSDFTASAQNSFGSDEDQNELQGNPDLVQEKSWRYEANLEWRLPEDAGVINTNIFYHDLEDIIGRVDVSPPGLVLSANGNVGDGERYGININTSLRLGFIGQPNMLLTASTSVEDSSIVDPFTGVERRVSRQGRGSSSIGLRHDIPSRNMNWGVNYRVGHNGNSVLYDIDKTESFEGDPTYFAWFETLGWGDLIYRFEARDSFYRCRLRTRYTNRSIGDGGLREIENSCFTSGPVLALKIRGTF